ncbi:MAG: 4-hydroxy-tetrahydrodipicolinate reductase [Polyangiaceae bacterium]
MTLRIAVVGASGRMGRAIARLAHGEGDVVVAAVAADMAGSDMGVLAGTERSGVLLETDLGAIARSHAEVVIDFSTANALPSVCEAARAAGIPLVSGTTGVSEAGAMAVERLAQDVAVLWEPNMSVGVHVMAIVLEQTLRLLGDDFDCEIVEVHHKFKADAPSGTANKLLEVVRHASSTSSGGSVVHGREGRPGARLRGEVGMHAVRGGDVIGDHTVHLLGIGERLELTHRATSRDLFAKGALRAAHFLRGKPKGRYGMREVVEDLARLQHDMGAPLESAP